MRNAYTIVIEHENEIGLKTTVDCTLTEEQIRVTREMNLDLPLMKFRTMLEDLNRNL